MFHSTGFEVFTLLGRMPFAVGYQPSLNSEMSSKKERKKVLLPIIEKAL